MQPTFNRLTINVTFVAKSLDAIELVRCFKDVSRGFCSAEYFQLDQSIWKVIYTLKLIVKILYVIS